MLGSRGAGCVFVLEPHDNTLVVLLSLLKPVASPRPLTFDSLHLGLHPLRQQMLNRQCTKEKGWLGIGFSDSGTMPGSDAVIGIPDEATALEYDMDGYNTPVESAEQVYKLCVCVRRCVCAEKMRVM